MGKARNSGRSQTFAKPLVSTERFEVVWALLRGRLAGRPRCTDHPKYPCISTLGGKTKKPVPNHVMPSDESKIVLQSHSPSPTNPKPGKTRSLTEELLRKWWNDLAAGLLVSMRTKADNCPDATHSSVVGAIWVHCLPERIERFGSHEIRLRPPAESNSIPEAVGETAGLTEGAAYEFISTAYERDPQARQECIAEYGARCSVCTMSFGEDYGPEAEGYIHVHHLRPLAEIRGEHRVDPVKDLRPVCPNCHAVLHIGGRCRSIEEVRRMLRR